MVCLYTLEYYVSWISLVNQTEQTPDTEKSRDKDDKRGDKRDLSVLCTWHLLSRIMHRTNPGHGEEWRRR